MYMVLVIKNMWKRRNKRWGSERNDLEKQSAKHEAHRNKIRYFFHSYGVAMNFCQQERARDILKPLLLEWFEGEKMKNKFRKFYTDIEKMQKKLRCIRVYRDAKLEVMLTYWEYMIKIIGSNPKARKSTKDMCN